MNHFTKRFPPVSKISPSASKQNSEHTSATLYNADHYDKLKHRVKVINTSDTSVSFASDTCPAKPEASL